MLSCWFSRRLIRSQRPHVALVMRKCYPYADLKANLPLYRHKQEMKKETKNDDTNNSSSNHNPTQQTNTQNNHRIEANYGHCLCGVSAYPSGPSPMTSLSRYWGGNQRWVAAWVDPCGHSLRQISSNSSDVHYTRNCRVSLPTLLNIGFWYFSSSVSRQ